jgi:hypothetical protein
VSSPFAPVLAGHGDLPAAFREQFLAPDGSRLRLDGTMSRVWRRRRWTRPLFAVLARMDVLFPETGEDVPATMTIDAGAGRHSWRRTFSFTRARAFDAALTWSDDAGAVVERMGPRDAIELVWAVRFHRPGTIEIETVEAALRVRGRRLRLPRLLAVHVRAVEVALPGHDDAITVDLTVSNPLLGPVFGYAGEFRLTRIDG